MVTFAFGAAACGPTVLDDDELRLAAADDELKRAVDPEKELVIVEPSIIEAPEETTFDPVRPSGDSKHGAWSFGRLVHNMLPPGLRDDPVAASSFVSNWLAQWGADQSPNPDASPSDARPNIDMVLTGPWRSASGCAADDEACTLDMAKAPFRLVAIVNRPDLRIVVADDGTAIGGEGRFVFQLMGPTLGRSAVGGPLEILDATPSPQKFMIIFEYSLPVADNAGTLEWAHRWHALGKHPFGAEYRAQLRSITNGFAGPDADPRRPNGNALNQLRTNEVATQGQRRFGAEAPLSTPQIWELREFRISAGGSLAQHTVNLEPARDYDIEWPTSVATFRAPFGTRSTELASFLVQSGDAVLAGKHAFPTAMLGNSVLVGSGGFGPWGRSSTTAAHTLITGDDPPARVADAVRDAFALNTCAGCHRHETATPHFMHLADRRSIDAVDQATVGLPPATNAEEERARISDTRIEGVARAGISSFGGQIAFGRTVVGCSGFDIEAEHYAGATFSFEKLDDNRCGCPTPDDECQVLSGGLEAPSALPTTP